MACVGTRRKLRREAFYRKNKKKGEAIAEEVPLVVERIVTRRIVNNTDGEDTMIQYLVKWENQPHENNTWEPGNRLQDMNEFLIRQSESMPNSSIRLSYQLRQRSISAPDLAKFSRMPSSINTPYQHVGPPESPHIPSTNSIPNPITSASLPSLPPPIQTNTPRFNTPRSCPSDSLQHVPLCRSRSFDQYPASGLPSIDKKGIGGKLKRTFSKRTRTLNTQSAETPFHIEYPKMERRNRRSEFFESKSNLKSLTEECAGENSNESQDNNGSQDNNTDIVSPTNIEQVTDAQKPESSLQQSLNDIISPSNTRIIPSRTLRRSQSVKSNLSYSRKNNSRHDQSSSQTTLVPERKNHIGYDQSSSQTTLVSKRNNPFRYDMPTSQTTLLPEGNHSTSNLSTSQPAYRPLRNLDMNDNSFLQSSSRTSSCSEHRVLRRASTVQNNKISNNNVTNSVITNNVPPSVRWKNAQLKMNLRQQQERRIRYSICKNL
jgi:hypothetical protein